jgi:hypothetical protein
MLVASGNLPQPVTSVIWHLLQDVTTAAATVRCWKRPLLLLLSQ